MARGAEVIIRVVIVPIVGHVWRSSNVAVQYRSECAYMNCRRPAGEHARVVDPSRARDGRHT